VAPLVGAPLTFAIWIAALATHGATRIAGPVWLLIGAVIYVGTRMAHRQAVLERALPPQARLRPGGEGVHGRLLVPMKLGPIGEEVLATAIKLAEERGSTVSALHVITVPMENTLDAEMSEP